MAVRFFAGYISHGLQLWPLKHPRSGHTGATFGIEPTSEQPPLVLALVGKCGTGKSSSANTLIGKRCFVARRAASAITVNSQSASTITAAGRTVCLVDTPGLGDPDSTPEALHKEMRRGVDRALEAYPGAEVRPSFLWARGEICSSDTPERAGVSRAGAWDARSRGGRRPARLWHSRCPPPVHLVRLPGAFHLSVLHRLT